MTLNQINMAAMDVPGWRIEQRFNNKCLIGNWSEERRKFQRGSEPYGNSTQRVDFKMYDGFKPRRNTRRKAELHNEGLKKDHLFKHHGNQYSNNMISWYDQQFNQRELTESNLPPLRTWDGKEMVWAPEKTDHPLQGAPTNVGLLEAARARWSAESEVEDLSRENSTSYGRSFKTYDASASNHPHHATPKPLSSHFHSHGVNKNLPMRNKAHVNIAPEHPVVLLEPTNRTLQVSNRSMRQHISRSNYGIEKPSST